MSEMMGWMMVWGALWVLIAAGALLFVVRYPRASKAPVRILEERFAAGEIDRNELEQGRALLT